MAIFAASFTVSQSADCTTLTFTDTSNYVDNDEGLIISDFDVREFIVKDYNYNVIDTIPLLDEALTGSFAVSADLWSSVELKLELPEEAGEYTVTHSVLSTCYLEKGYSELVANTESGCSCGTSCNCESTSNDKVLLLEYIKAAEIFSEYSNPVLAQKQLDAGTALLNANENN